MTTYILGSIYGNSKQLVALLAHAGLIVSTSNRSWTPGCSDTLIQTGNLISKDPRSVDCLALLQKLQREAKQYNGKVVRLAGSQEISCLDGSPSYFTFQNKAKKVIEWEIREGVLRKTIWAATHLQHRWLVTHAGLSFPVCAQLDDKYGVLFLGICKALNNAFLEAVQNKDYSHPIFYTGGYEPKNATKSAGIFWWDEYRDLIDIRQLVGANDDANMSQTGKVLNVTCGFTRLGRQGILKLEDKTLSSIYLPKRVK